MLAMLAAGWMVPAHATQAADAAPAMEVCTAQGLIWGHVGGEGGAAQGASLFEHCPLCSAGAVLPPADPRGGFRLPPAASVLPITALYPIPAHAAPDWPAARPRAPPEFLFPA